jgi:hypothetical protein
LAVEELLHTVAALKKTEVHGDWEEGLRKGFGGIGREGLWYDEAKVKY